MQAGLRLVALSLTLAFAGGSALAHDPPRRSCHQCDRHHAAGQHGHGQGHGQGHGHSSPHRGHHADGHHGTHHGTRHRHGRHQRYYQQSYGPGAFDPVCWREDRTGRHEDRPAVVSVRVCANGDGQFRVQRGSQRLVYYLRDDA